MNRLFKREEFSCGVKSPSFSATVPSVKSEKTVELACPFREGSSGKAIFILGGNEQPRAIIRLPLRLSLFSDNSRLHIRQLNSPFLCIGTSATEGGGLAKGRNGSSMFLSKYSVSVLSPLRLARCMAVDRFFDAWVKFKRRTKEGVGNDLVWFRQIFSGAGCPFHSWQGRKFGWNLGSVRIRPFKYNTLSLFKEHSSSLNGAVCGRWVRPVCRETSACNAQGCFPKL